MAGIIQEEIIKLPTRDGYGRGLVTAGKKNKNVVVLDADEIWDAEYLRSAIKQAAEGDAWSYKAHMIHFWRSFDYVCEDPSMPDRVIVLGRTPGTYGYIEQRGLKPIMHFGYARSLADIFYKWEIHGHLGELRKNWFHEIFSQWPPVDDCHPTCEKNFWMPKHYDKTQMPDFMKEHPYYELEYIA